MEKILISACLFGENVRYDANNTLLDDPLLESWRAEGRLVPLCPEVAGGLPIPRKPCERDPETNRILSKDGEDFSDAYQSGAKIALELVRQHNIRFALLKERSPSCGVNVIYDGHFSGTKIPGQGLTTQYLNTHGVKTYSEFDLNRLKADFSEA